MIKACDSDISSFWREIDSIKMGLASDWKQRIPIEVVENCEITTDINKVLDCWGNDFKGIYETVVGGQFDEEHLAFINM